MLPHLRMIGNHMLRRPYIAVIIVPLLLSGCMKDLFGGDSNVLRPDIIKYKGTTDTPKPPAKEVCPEPGEGKTPAGSQEMPPTAEKQCPPVEQKLLPRELPSGFPEQLMPIPPPVPAKPGGTPQSGGADHDRRLTIVPKPDLSYRDAVLTEDLSWRGEVNVAGVVTVPPQTTLTIEPGTIIRFGGNDMNTGHPALLLVHGRLVAKGTRENPVLFTARFTQPMAGDWQGIALVGSEKKNLLENCRVEGAETGLDASFSTVTLKNVHFSRCGMGARLRDTVVSSSGGGASGCITGVHLADSEADLRDAVFSGNRQGIVAVKSSLYLAGGSFTRNDLDAVKAEESQVKVAGGSFTANGAGLTMVSCQGGVSGARLSENADYGIRLANSRVKVFGNEISRNNGAGIKVEDGKGVAWGNAICENGGFNLVNAGTEEFRAMGNWWGVSDAAAIGNKIHDGRTANSRGRVFYIPCLASNPVSHL